MKKAIFPAIASLLVFSTCGLIFLAGELYLRRKGTFDVYCERTKLECEEKEVLKNPWLLVSDPDTTYHINTGEFHQQVKTNAEGLRGELPAQVKPKGERRVVFLGDSFTFGVGAENGLGLVEVFADSLKKKKTGKYVVMNAGVPGSDPVFERELLERRLLAYQPDLVVMIVNSSDVRDVIQRGGKERYSPEGMLLPVKQNFLQRVAARSHILRAILVGGMGYSFDYIPWNEVERLKVEAMNPLVDDLAQSRSLAEKKGFRLVVVSLPISAEVREDPKFTDSARLMAILRDRGFPAV